MFGEAFWHTTPALFLVGGLAGLAVLLLDWRLTLPGALALQFSFGQLMAARYGLPVRWQMVYLGVTLLAALILLSPVFQGRARAVLPRGDDMAFRGLLLVLAALLLSSVDVHQILPVVDGQVGQLVLWMAGCALLILSLSDGALHTGMGLLLWSITVQTVLSTLLPQPILAAMLGTLLLVASLACSYLLLAENTELAVREQPLTDIAFPAKRAERRPWTLDEAVDSLRARLVRLWATLVNATGLGARS